MHRRYIGFFLLGLIGLSGARAAELTAPQQSIHDAATELRAALNENTVQLMDDPNYIHRIANQVLMPLVDMNKVSSLVLGRNWRKADTAQKQAFSREFQQLLVRTYATAMREMGDWQIRFPPLRIKPGDKRLLVKSQLLRDGAKPAAIDYSMYLKDGQWLTYDVKVEGISLVTNYRANFNRVVRQKGIDGLIAQIRALNEEKRGKSDGRMTAGAGESL